MRLLRLPNGRSDPTAPAAHPASGRFASPSLLSRLLAVILAVALPLLLLAGGTAWDHYRTDHKRAESQLLQQARSMALMVDRQFALTEAVLRTLASSDALARGDLKAFLMELRAARDQLDAAHVQAPDFVALRLVDANGNLRLDTRQRANLPTHAIASAMASIASGKPQISNLFFGTLTKRPLVVVSVPEFAPGSGPGPRKVVGSVGANLPRAGLLPVVDLASFPQGTVVSVQDPRGMTVVRSAADAATVGKPPAGAVLNAILSADSGVLSHVRTQDGVLSTVAYARAPVSRFTVKIAVPDRTFLAPLQAALVRTAAIGVALLVVAGSLAWLFGRQIAAAIQRVPGVAAAQANGVAGTSTGLREADELAVVLGDTLAERTRAEERLREGEERLRLAVESAEVGLWDVDPVNNVMYWPPRVKTMFGISPDLPVSIADFYAGLHPDDLPHVSKAFAAALDPLVRGLYDVEYRTVGKEDQVIRWVAAKGRGIFNEDGRCVRVIGTAIDISARKAAERQLHELNETLEQRVDQAITERDRVWRNSRDLLVVLGADGIFRAVNPAWTGILGHLPAEVVGRSFRDFVWPDDADMTQHGLETAASVSDLTNFENRYRHKDGTPRWISWHTTREGELIYAYGRHITAEKAAAAELAAAQESLHQAQKIETIGQLTGGVAHDFNNLLTPIFGTLELLHRKLADDQSAQRLTRAALQAAESARTLIQRLLAFSRRQHLEARAVDVRTLIESLADLASRSLGPQIRLVLHIADDLPPARVDPNQLELALLNLAVNARDAMGGVGTLTIAVARETVTQLGRLPPGDYIRIAVIDTGCGMDEETLKRAVEPFFTTKGVGRGTGLGLSMVHGLAAQSGGSFGLQSAVGAGTTATLWLPVSEEAMLRSRPDSGASPASRHVDAATVLLVDDEELVRSTTADMLADAGFIVSEAGSAKQALEMLKSGLEPDALVTDYAMPAMTGGALAREARILRPGLPVLLITGYASLSDQEAGSLPRLSKPFRQSDLVAMLGALLETAGKLPQAVE